MSEPKAPRAATGFSDEEMAYHESGHAVIHSLGGGTVTRLSIVRTDPKRGTHTAGSPPKPPASAGDETHVRRWIGTLLAGEAADVIHGGQRRPEASAGDRETALNAARTVVSSDDAARAMLDEEWDVVLARLREPAVWRQVETLATALTQDHVLSGEEITRLLASASAPE